MIAYILRSMPALRSRFGLAALAAVAVIAALTLILGVPLYIMARRRDNQLDRF